MILDIRINKFHSEFDKTKNIFQCKHGLPRRLRHSKIIILKFWDHANLISNTENGSAIAALFVSKVSVANSFSHLENLLLWTYIAHVSFHSRVFWHIKVELTSKSFFF